MDLITLQRLEEQSRVDFGKDQRRFCPRCRRYYYSRVHREIYGAEKYSPEHEGSGEALKNVKTLQAQVEDWENVDISGCSDALVEDISRLQNMLERIYELVTSDAVDDYPQLRSSARDLRFRLSSLKKAFTEELDSRIDSDSFEKYNIGFEVSFFR